MEVVVNARELGDVGPTFYQRWPMQGATAPNLPFSWYAWKADFRCQEVSWGFGGQWRNRVHALNYMQMLDILKMKSQWKIIHNFWNTSINSKQHTFILHRFTRWIKHLKLFSNIIETISNNWCCNHNQGCNQWKI